MDKMRERLIKRAIDSIKESQINVDIVSHNLPKCETDSLLKAQGIMIRRLEHRIAEIKRMYTPLDSVGCAIHTETCIVYPLNEDGTIDMTSTMGTPVMRTSREWLGNLSQADFETLLAITDLADWDNLPETHQPLYQEK